MAEIKEGTRSTPVVERQKPQKKKRTKEDAKDAHHVLKKGIEYVTRSVLAHTMVAKKPLSITNVSSWFEGVEIEARVVRYEWIFDKKMWRKADCTLPESDLSPLVEDLKKRTNCTDWEFSRDAYFDASVAISKIPGAPSEEAPPLASAFEAAAKAHPRVETSYRQTASYSASDFGRTNVLGAKRKIAQVDLKPCIEPTIGSSKKKSLEEKRKQEEEYHRESDYSKIETISGKSVYGLRLCASLEWQTESAEDFARFVRRASSLPSSSEPPAESDAKTGQKCKVTLYEPTKRIRCKARKSFARTDGTGTRYDLTYCMEAETMTLCEERFKNFFENCENRRKRKKVAHAWEDVEPSAEFEIEFDMASLASEAKKIAESEDPEAIEKDDEEARMAVMDAIVDLMARDIEDVVVSYYGLQRSHEL